MVNYLLLRIANYAVLLFIAVSLAWVLAQTQLHPRQLFEVAPRRSTRVDREQSCVGERVRSCSLVGPLPVCFGGLPALGLG